MDDQAQLSVAELATLEDIDLPSGYDTKPTEATAKLVALDFIKPTPLGFYLTRAGKLRLRTERSLADEGRRSGRILHGILRKSSGL